MKLAILGSSPLALEAAVRFHLHGAGLTWFNHAEAGEAYFFQAKAWDQATSDSGWTLLGAKASGPFSLEAWREQYLHPLVTVLKTAQSVKTFELVSITKRYVGKDEAIRGRSRFYDLFRVIYQLNPQEFIDSQKESDPALFTKLNQEMIQSLQSTLEMYEDFDLIVDLRHPTELQTMAVTGRAMGEKRLTDRLHYGLRAWEAAETMTQETRDCVLIGSGELAVETLLRLSTWLRDPRSMLFLVTSEEEPFSAVREDLLPESRKKLDDLLVYMEGEFEKEVNTFHHKLREWQELDDFVRAKYPRPAEPIPRLNFFSGHNVTAIDQLVDRKKFFLTLERPDFREGKKHPENNLVELKTIGVDEVLVCLPTEKKDILFLQTEEKGYATVLPSRGNWTGDLAKLKGIENEIFKLFSPLHPH